ncbi:MAG: nucleotidyltransferase domain-containing protein [Hyphomonadaceae bacterium]|nr:nucleotidyltransferase domain-containing protein [Hyphomonadaceae bacterium]
MTRDEVLTKLRELKPWLESQGIGRVRLFGSHARDEAGPDSDIDLLVEFTKPIGLAFFDIEEELGQRLGAKVSFASEGQLNRVIRKYALADAIDA